MERGIGDVFVDALDTATQLAILDRYGERASERSEGPTEFANPQTVSQPVHQSQFPGGQPRNFAGGILLSPTVLIVAGIAVTGLLTFLILRK